MDNKIISVSDAAKKLYYRLLDINVGSTYHGQDIFSDVENRDEIITQFKNLLNSFNEGAIDINQLKEKTMSLEACYDSEDLSHCYSVFVKDFEPLSEKVLMWMADDLDEFEEFMYESFDDYINKRLSMAKRCYENRKAEFDNL